MGSNLSIERQCAVCEAVVTAPRSPFCSKSCGKKASYWKKPEYYRAKAVTWGQAPPKAKKAAVERYKQRHPDYNRRHIVGKYGLKPEDYDAMLHKQGSACAAC